jgi:hypothetical protein
VHLNVIEKEDVELLTLVAMREEKDVLGEVVPHEFEVVNADV